MKLRVFLPLAGLVLVAAIPPAPVDETARAKELLKPMVGMWDSEMTFMGMGPLKGTEDVKLAGGGLVATVTAISAGGPTGSFEGHGMFGYDPKAKVWHHVWSDNTEPGLFVSEGAWSADGKSFIIEDEADLGMGGGPQMMVMTQTITGEDTREFTMKPKDAKPETPPMISAKYKRRAN